jgi:integrase
MGKLRRARNQARSETASAKAQAGDWVIDHEMKEVLERLLKDSQCDYLFTSPQDPTKPLGPWVLEEQIGQIRKKIQTHPDAGLHAMRHTF